jgi:hypothetical protein
LSEETPTHGPGPGSAIFQGIRTPGAPDTAPEFPPNIDWVGAPFFRVAQELGRHGLLVEFFDTARVNSIRTQPYLAAWHERYAEAGLRVVGVHSPGYSFGRDREMALRAIEALGVPYPVALDPALEVWRIYRNRGWPARYLFDRAGVLRHMHYGEGEYVATELAIHQVLHEIDGELELPEPMEPLRPEDAPGVILEAQTADIALPDDRDRVDLVRDWTDGPDYIEAADAGAAITPSFSRAGAAYAVLSGADVEPGLHQTDGTVVAESPGLRVHGFQFTPAPPGD